MVSKGMAGGGRVGIALVVAALVGPGCRVEVPSPDGGSLDGGSEETCPEAPSADSGVLVTACDPATGQRCDVSRRQTCHWDVLADEGECRCASDRAALGQPCALGRQNCEGGLTCLFFSGDAQPTCRAVCALDDARGCEPLLEREPDHAVACVPVRRGPDATLTTRFGVCVDVGQACDPLDDRCPAGEKCSVQGLTAACADEGTAGLGAPCAQAGCARGGLCVALVDRAGNEFPPECYAPCDVSRPSCVEGDCVDVGLPVGVCFGP